MQTLPSFFLHELTREQLRAAAPDTLVVLPVGATEQHGPHLPVGTDWLVVQHVAAAAAEAAGASIPVLVAPVLPFGSSHHHLPFGGTLSIKTETYYRLIYDLCESLVVSGFRSLFILNGHGGNHEIIQLVARDLALQRPVKVGAASYWAIAWDALVEAGAHLAGDLPGHAGIFESSLILALRPELARAPRPHRDTFDPTDPRGRQDPYRAEIAGAWQAIGGFTDSPDQADGDRGRRCLAAIVGAVKEALVEFHQLPIA